MKFFDTVNDGMVQTMNDFCGTTTNTYSFKKKARDANDALDWYCAIAFMSGLNWEFDDITQTSPPIDTQNLSTTTNRYKLNAFTEKIINLIKLEALDSNGKGINLIPETFDTLGSQGTGNESGVIAGISSDTFQERYLNAPSGTPKYYIKFGDYIYLDKTPSYNSTGGLKAYFNRPATKFTFIPFTVTIASPGVFTATAHGLVAGDTVILETDGALPTGLTVDTQYYVISSGLTADAFQLSTTSGGSAINTSSTQSGNHAFLKTNKEPGVNIMHHVALCRKAAVNFMTFNNTNGIYNSRLSLVMPEHIKDEKQIAAFFGKRDKDIRKRLTPAYQNNK